MRTDPDLRGAANPRVAESSGSALRPLHSTAFRVLWTATIVSNVGAWIHDVGAAWLMTELTSSPLMVSLVQTATTLPVLLFALPAGALADVFDRRRVLIAAQVWMTAAAGSLALLTYAGGITATSLLLLTVAMGVGTALSAPAWQSIVPELVPPGELPAAVTLNSAGINVARAVGPAIGGVLIAAFGPAIAFLANALSFFGVTGGLLWWRRPTPATSLPREQLGEAVGLGVRYVRNNPQLLVVLWRTMSFIVFGSALWALLPIVARTQLGATASGYGVLLGAIGVGALLATPILPMLRERLSADTLVVLATLSYAGVMMVAALVGEFAIVLGALVIAGGAWLVLLATFQTGAQLTVPSWVRGRALALYLMVFFGGQAFGSVAWGFCAEHAGVPLALSLAAVGAALALVVQRWFPLNALKRVDHSSSRYWPAHDAVPLDANARTERRVLVTTEYIVREQEQVDFTRAMMPLRRARLRSGAHSWELAQDMANPERWLELFTLSSWEAHLRQHERASADDWDVRVAARRFHVAEQDPVVTHLLIAR